MSCHSCGKLSSLRQVPAGGRAACRRCAAWVHVRKPDSVARTWALVITGAILYVPANIYPIMTVHFMGRGEPDTILSGVKHLFASGSWLVAILVFFASVTVPLVKLIGLSYLLLSIQLGWKWRPRDRTALYRLIEAVGRWSMLDLFMISVLVGLVRLGEIATVSPGAGATFFAAVVVVTMLAAMCFDPRLIWDSVEEKA